MLPLQDVLPSRHRPYVVLTLVGAIGGAWFAQLSLDPARLAGLIEGYGWSASDGRLWRIWTSLALSPATIPTVTNVAAFWIFGDNVEDRLGAWRLALLGLLGALVAAIVARELSVDRAPILGAAGLAGGLVGAHLSLFPRMRVLVLVPFGRDLDAVEVPSAFVAMAWLLCQGFSWQAAPAVAPAAVVTFALPLAGLAAGALLVQLLKRRDRMRAEWWSPVRDRRASRSLSA